ncbi:uncharacterized protein KY384_005330 [Bacidia gigantensis]|uniref:uncharacterized protein n=1 Tax=Bacidia gigantensis TaxID=2732470 RepID=UPI001D04EDC7|nr:uncharacterized protein KY384_005330 [Bacidia gigantensis]KAG8529849.1 hypothetical protein KY384_005330 [Bacidia gigantensis]
MDTLKNAGRNISENIQGATSGVSYEANKNVAKSSDASISTRATAAKDAVGDKVDEKKHDHKAELAKQKADLTSSDDLGLHSEDGKSTHASQQIEGPPPIPRYSRRLARISENHASRMKQVLSKPTSTGVSSYGYGIDCDDLPRDKTPLFRQQSVSDGSRPRGSPPILKDEGLTEGEIADSSVEEKQPVAPDQFDPRYETSRVEISSYYAYYIGDNGLSLFNFAPTAFQNLVSEAAGDAGVLRFAGSERNINSIVLLCNVDGGIPRPSSQYTRAA